jgi:hypothetical protein
LAQRSQYPLPSVVRTAAVTGTTWGLGCP